MSRKVTLPHDGWRPRDYQRGAWRAFRNPAIKTIVLGWHRRCMAEGTPVLMANGSYKPIEQIAVGDRVLVWVDGRYEIDEVIDTLDQGEKECVTVTAKGFPEVTCTPDHEFLRGQDRGKRPEFSEIAGAGNPFLICYSGHNTGEWHDPDKARFLGLMHTDGYCVWNQQPKFTTTSEALLNDMEALVSRLFPTVRVRRRMKGNGWDVGMSNGTRGGGEIPNPVKTYFGEARKSERRIHSDMWLADDDTLAAFFSGVIDGDGSIEIRARRDGEVPHASVKIHAGVSEGLARDYDALLAKLGIRSSSVKVRGRACWTVLIGDNEEAVRFLRKLNCKHESKARLIEQVRTLPEGRKRVRGDNCHIAQFNLTPAGTHRVYDITTRNHHRFIAGKFVVHNCGKDDIAMHGTACKAMERVGNYYHCLPEYGQARKAIWEAVNPRTGRVRWKDAFPEGIVKHADNQAMKLTFMNGSTWQLVGSDNPDSLMGTTPVGVVFSEAALANPNTFGFFKPILLENKGWSAHISSTRGKNHFYQLHEISKNDPTAFCEVLSAEDTGVFTPEQLESERLTYIALYGHAIGSSLFEQEYLSSWDAATIGAVFGQELRDLEKEGRALPLRYDRRFPVDTSWDLGVGDATVIMFWQTVGNSERLIDCYSATDTGLEHFADVLKQKGYLYRHHFAPHDIAVREWGANGVSRMSQAKRLGIKFTPTPNISKADSIALGSQLIGRMEINVQESHDAEDCAAILELLKQYRFKYDKERKVMSKSPEHGPESHFADALLVRAFHAAADTGAARLPSGPTGEIEHAHPMRLRDIMHAHNRTAMGRGAWG